MSDWDFFVQSLRVSLKAFAAIAAVGAAALILVWVFWKERN